MSEIKKWIIILTMAILTSCIGALLLQFVIMPK